MPIPPNFVPPTHLFKGTLAKASAGVEITDSSTNYQWTEVSAYVESKDFLPMPPKNPPPLHLLTRNVFGTSADAKITGAVPMPPKDPPPPHLLIGKLANTSAYARSSEPLKELPLTSKFGPPQPPASLVPWIYLTSTGDNKKNNIDKKLHTIPTEMHRLPFNSIKPTSPSELSQSADEHNSWAQRISRGEAASDNDLQNGDDDCDDAWLKRKAWEREALETIWCMKNDPLDYIRALVSPNRHKRPRQWRDY